MINGRNFFDQTIKIDLKTYDNIQKIATGQGDTYIPGCLLDYPYFKEYYKLITIDLLKQQKLDADPKTIQQINIIGNLNRAEGSKMFFFLIEELNGTVLNFSKRTVRVFILFRLNVMSI